MQMTRLKKSLSLIVCIVLIAAMALFTTGCNDNKTDLGSTAQPAISQAEKQVRGEGAKTFALTVIDAAGKETAYEIHTDKETVGDALMALGLLAGENGNFGLYVKTVDGKTVDFDKDGKYWAFYVNGDYAAKGVDATPITEGATYCFKVE